MCQNFVEATNLIAAPAAPAPAINVGDAKLQPDGFGEIQILKKNTDFDDAAIPWLQKGKIVAIKIVKANTKLPGHGIVIGYQGAKEIAEKVKIVQTHYITSLVSKSRPVPNQAGLQVESEYFDLGLGKFLPQMTTDLNKIKYNISTPAGTDIESVAGTFLAGAPPFTWLAYAYQHPTTSGSITDQVIKANPGCGIRTEVHYNTYLIHEGQMLGIARWTSSSVWEHNRFIAQNAISDIEVLGNSKTNPVGMSQAEYDLLRADPQSNWLNFIQGLVR